MEQTTIGGLLKIEPQSLTTISNTTNNNSQAPDWLSYETLFNQTVFRKSNQQHEMGLYVMSLDEVSVFLLPGIPEELRAILIQAFFPLSKEGTIVEKAQADCPWIPVATNLTSSENYVTPKSVFGSRNNNVINVASDVAVMLYNFSDNQWGSTSIGTYDQSQKDAPLTRLLKTWPMWKTASRSCVVKLGKLEKDDLDKKRTDVWPFGGGQPVDVDGEAQKGTALLLSACDMTYIGVKTGITHVGSRDMNGQKETLQMDIYYGCLQSAYIAIRNTRKNHDMQSDSWLAIMLEILGICEGSKVLKTPVNLQPAKSDGMLVRDLSCLHRKKVYLPPLSLPFVDKTGSQRTDRFALINDQSWCDFWGRHYARNLGRAKALLFLRYGMQLETPNPQNFLVECDRDGGQLEPTGKIVVRDIGDGHSFPEVVWELNKKMHATDSSDDCSFEQQPFAECFARLCRHVSAKIRLHWHDYSTLSKALGITAEASSLGIDPDVRAPGWPRVFRVMAEWGLIHHRTYVEVIANVLSDIYSVYQNHFENIWSKHPDPARFERLHEMFPPGLLDALQEWKGTLDDKTANERIKPLLPHDLKVKTEILKLKPQPASADELIRLCEYFYAEQLYGEFIVWEETVGDLLTSILLDGRNLGFMVTAPWDGMGHLFDPQPQSSATTTNNNNATTSSSTIKKKNDVEFPEYDESDWT